MAGCSGSGDGSSGETPTPTDSETSEVGNDDSVSNDVSDTPDNTPDIVTPTDDDSATDDDSETDNDSVVVNPVIQNTVQVTFDITVPAYQSSELRIELDWGDMNLTAAWVGDEYWSASSELPTDTEDLLIVTFYDYNGDIVLARFSQEFRTGSNATVAFQISADQFDSNQFDDDGDGINNLDELIAGRDPTVDEDSLLEIVNVYHISQDNRMSITDEFERRLSEVRPISIMTEEFPTSSSSITLDINIDSGGTGTLSHEYRFGSQSIRHTGTRTHSDNAISWEASRFAFDGDYHHRVAVNNTVTFVDENTRTFYEEIDASNTGTYQFRWESSIDLTARLIEGTSLCEPLYGTMRARDSDNRDGLSVAEATASKEKDDLYWRVVVVYTDTQFITVAPDIVTTRSNEFFARNLRIGSISNASDSGSASASDFDSPTFLCDFVEF